MLGWSVVGSSQTHRRLFLAGLHRSGTSVLHRMLREHPMISGFSGTGVPEDEGQHLQSVMPPARAYGGPGRFAFSPESYLNECSELATEENAELLRAQWDRFHDLSRRILLEKSPPNIIRSRLLQAFFPDSCFIFIVRHPLVVSLATLKWSDTSVMELMFHWCVAHRAMLSDLPALKNFMVLRYEDFVRDPISTLDDVCSKLGIHAYTPVEELKDRNPEYLDRWSASFVREQQMLQELAPETITIARDFGYLLEPPYVCAPAGSPPIFFSCR